MKYEFTCTRCGNKQDVSMSYGDRVEEENKAELGKHTVFCLECKSPAAYSFVPGASISMKGVGWVSRDTRESKFRDEHTREMTRRQKDHVPVPKLIPNYGGEEAGRWSDVRDHVRSTKGVDAASTYDKLVEAETIG